MNKLEQIEALVKDWRKEANKTRSEVKTEWDKGAFDVLETVVQELEDVLNN